MRDGDSWRRGYDDHWTTDPRDVPTADVGPRPPCRICLGTARSPAGELTCHTARERDAAANAARAVPR